MNKAENEKKVEEAIMSAVQNGVDTAGGDPGSPVFYEVAQMTLLMIADDQGLDLSVNEYAQEILSW